jgi:Flp pilus assembly protein TadG
MIRALYRRSHADLMRLVRAEAGATMVEFALVLPALVVMIIAIMQFSLFFFAAASIQHMLGEGARSAILFPTPSDATILARMNAVRFVSSYGTFTTSISSPTTSTKRLEVRFTFTPTVPFQAFGPITVNRSKLVYLSI